MSLAAKRYLRAIKNIWDGWLDNKGTLYPTPEGHVQWAHNNLQLIKKPSKLFIVDSFYDAGWVRLNVDHNKNQIIVTGPQPNRSQKDFLLEIRKASSVPVDIEWASRSGGRIVSLET